MKEESNGRGGNNIQKTVSVLFTLALLVVACLLGVAALLEYFPKMLPTMINRADQMLNTMIDHTRQVYTSQTGFVLLGAALVLIIYFLPTLIALRRVHQYRGVIFVLNLFLGITGIGYVAALAWAVWPMGPTTGSNAAGNSSSFAVYGKCEIKKDGVTVEEVGRILKKSLSKHYDEYKISLTPTGLMVNGNLKSIWERAITKASAEIMIDGPDLSFRVDGTSSLGGWPWVWFALGFCTGFFFVWFGWDLIEYIICRDRPKRYFEEAFQAVVFELERSPQPVPAAVATIGFEEQLRTLAKLRDDGVITEEDFGEKKRELLGL
ncbi:MAG: superinfection immunity protein [Limisphaerales bacterium]